MRSRDDKTQARQWMKFAGLAFEFVAIIGFCGYLGYLANKQFDCDPWGLLVGLLLGLTAGIYQLLKATRALEQGPKQ